MLLNSLYNKTFSLMNPCFFTLLLMIITILCAYFFAFTAAAGVGPSGPFNGDDGKQCSFAPLPNAKVIDPSCSGEVATISDAFVENVNGQDVLVRKLSFNGHRSETLCLATTLADTDKKEVYLTPNVKVTIADIIHTVSIAAADWRSTDVTVEDNYWPVTIAYTSEQCDHDAVGNLDKVAARGVQPVLLETYKTGSASGACGYRVWFRKDVDPCVLLLKTGHSVLTSVRYHVMVSGSSGVASNSSFDVEYQTDTNIPISPAGPAGNATVAVDYITSSGDFSADLESQNLVWDNRSLYDGSDFNSALSATDHRKKFWAPCSISIDQLKANHVYANNDGSLPPHEDYSASFTNDLVKPSWTSNYASVTYSSSSGQLQVSGDTKTRLTTVFRVTTPITKVFRSFGIISDFSCTADNLNDTKSISCVVSSASTNGQAVLGLYLNDSCTPVTTGMLNADSGANVTLDATVYPGSGDAEAAWVCTEFGVCKSVVITRKFTSPYGIDHIKGDSTSDDGGNAFLSFFRSIGDWFMSLANWAKVLLTVLPAIAIALLIWRLVKCCRSRQHKTQELVITNKA